MAEMVLPARTLPDSLFQLISTENVRVREDSNGEIRLIPISEAGKQTRSCPFLGLYTDGKLTVDGYLKRKRADRELEL